MILCGSASTSAKPNAAFYVDAWPCTIAYKWSRAGQALTDVGTTTSEPTILRAQPSDACDYTVTASADCSKVASEPAAKGAETCFPPRIPEHQRPCRPSFKSPARTANSRLSSSPTRLKCDDPGRTSFDERINHRHIRPQQQSYLQNEGTRGSIYE